MQPDRRLLRLLLLAALLAGPTLAGSARAAASQDPAAVEAVARQFLKVQTRDAPGRVAIRVKAPTTALHACAALEAFQPAGSRRFGKLTLGVRCLAPTAWTLYLAAEVEVVAPYLVTRNALPANHVLSEHDFQVVEGDLGRLPADVMTDPEAVIGFRTVSGLAAGAALRAAIVRPPLVVQQGQVTRVILNGPGFSVQNEGQALANASRGERVRVKLRSGQIVSGVAHDGQQVTVAF